MLFCFPCGCGRPKRGAEKPVEMKQEMTVEEMSHQVQVKYAEAIGLGLSKEKARDRVVAFLQSLKNIKVVKATGSDTLQVIFTDGNELLLMLGKDRL